MAVTPDDALKSMIANLPEKTGKNLDAWLAAAKATGQTKHMAVVKALKADHGLSHGYANTVAHIFLNGMPGSGAGDDLVAAQYDAKAHMRPWYERLASAAVSFGADVELAPKKAYVSLRRAKQFGLIQPSTKSRMDIGLVLKGVDPAGRLEAAGSWNAMVTHRIRIASADEIDDEVLGYLRRAYDAAD